MKVTAIINANVINEGSIKKMHILIEGDRIKDVSDDLKSIPNDAVIIDAAGKHLIPGMIDAQVHFRDPGLTHKADIYTESKAAVAGGVTSFIDMPNTVPNVLHHDIWEEKFRIASQKSLANYDFFMGINKDNIDEVLSSDTSNYSALSDDGLYFSGKGNLLADNPEVLEKIFSGTKNIVAIHSEMEKMILENEEQYRAKYGENVPVSAHPLIRSEEACYESTKRAIELARKHDARLHILHLTTAKETSLFRNDIPLKEKRITTEASVHHLWFTDRDYDEKGMLIKWNPAIKTERDKLGLLEAVSDDRIDIITTDHAPHDISEKQNTYFKSMSGAPLVQHALVVLFELYHQGYLTLEKIVEKTSHNVAELYGFAERGYIRKGYKADLVLVDLNRKWEVKKENILYKCGWSPLEGKTFSSTITHTFVNGHLVYENGKFDESKKGEQLKLLPFEERVYNRTNAINK